VIVLLAFSPMASCWCDPRVKGGLERADFVAIRIVRGAERGEYRQVESPQGREWLRLDGTGARIFMGAADRADRSGHLTILLTVPNATTKGPSGPAMVPTAPTPLVAPRDVLAEDEAYSSAFDLARDGIDAEPRNGLTEGVQVAFLQGLRDGARQRDVVLEATDRLQHAGIESEMPQNNRAKVPDGTILLLPSDRTQSHPSSAPRGSDQTRPPIRSVRHRPARCGWKSAARSSGARLRGRSRLPCQNPSPHPIDDRRANSGAIALSIERPRATMDRSTRPG
jgi:hypothetical protein